MSVAIHLDTNVLILGLRAAHPAQRLVTRSIEAGSKLAVSAMAWSEFRCGPLSPEVAAAWEGLLEGRVISMDRTVAELAAELFNRSGRRSRSLPDCVIAATAMSAGARLATLNPDDFAVFSRYGLALA